jgi:hypothetical protein
MTQKTEVWYAWQETLHLWNKWVAGVMQWCGINTWSHRCLEQHWRLGMYVVNLLKIVGFVVHLHGFLLAVMCIILPVTLRLTNLKFTHVTANLATGKLQLETLIFGNS